MLFIFLFFIMDGNTVKYMLIYSPSVTKYLASINGFTFKLVFEHFRHVMKLSTSRTTPPFYAPSVITYQTTPLVE